MEDDLTALRTQIGTKGYLAPEITGLFPDTSNRSKMIERGSYTSAVDIWALGEICFKLITNRPAFSAPRDLVDYVVRGQDFPYALLYDHGVTLNCISFINLTMSALATDRPSAYEAMRYPWMITQEVEGSNAPFPVGERQTDVTTVADSQAFEATAQWSTLSGSATMSPSSRAPKLRGITPMIAVSSRKKESETKLVPNPHPLQTKERNMSGLIIPTASLGEVSPVLQSLPPLLDHREPTSPQYSSPARQTVDEFFFTDSETVESDVRYWAKVYSSSNATYSRTRPAVKALDAGALDTVTATPASVSKKVVRKSRSSSCDREMVDTALKPSKDLIIPDKKQQSRGRASYKLDVEAEKSLRCLSTDAQKGSDLSLPLSGSPEVSINDPKQLSSVLKAIRRLIVPESEFSGREQRNPRDEEFYSTFTSTSHLRTNKRKSGAARSSISQRHENSKKSSGH